MPAGTAFASTASMDIPAGEMVQQGASQASMDSVDFDDESTVFLTAPKVAIVSILHTVSSGADSDTCTQTCLVLNQCTF